MDGDGDGDYEEEEAEMEAVDDKQGGIADGEPEEGDGDDTGMEGEACAVTIGAQVEAQKTVIIEAVIKDRGAAQVAGGGEQQEGRGWEQGHENADDTEGEEERAGSDEEVAKHYCGMPWYSDDGE